MFRYLPDFAGLFCITLFVFSCATIGGMLIRDGDTFWHIQAGAIIIEQGALITQDTFSHTAFGQPWTSHEWLAEIIMAGLHEIAGLEGVACFFLFLVSLSFWMLFKTTEKTAKPWITVFCLAIAVVLSASHMSARPHLFTWLFTMLTLAILTRGGKHLYWLPLIIIPWANLHGGFVLCLVLQGIFIAGQVLDDFFVTHQPLRESLQKQKNALLVFSLCLVTCCINPFGYELLLFPFQVTKGVFSKIITEWNPPDFQARWYFRYYLIGLVLLVSFARSRVNWTERLLLLFFLNAALTHVRHFSLMVMVFTPFIAREIDLFCDRWLKQTNLPVRDSEMQTSSKSGPLLVLGLLCLLLFAGAINTKALSFMTPKELFNTEFSEIEGLVDYLNTSVPEGNMFNDYVLGGYLIYALKLAPKVFIDGRADMYGETILSDYIAIKGSMTKREQLLDQYEIDWVVFEKNSERVKSLEDSGQWLTEYSNKHYAVLTRSNDSGTKDIINKPARKL